jgi:hypothetical protein
MRWCWMMWWIAVPVVAQSMTEATAVFAGSTVGSAAGKKVSEGIDKTLRKSGRALDRAAQSPDAAAPSRAAAEPLLKVSPGVPKTERNNVPPPPPRRAASARPAPRRPAPVRAYELPAPLVSPAPQPAADVDLAAIRLGMPRDAVLKLGTPSARISLSQDGHLVEIFRFHNTELASGAVRLVDGAVAAIEARP